MIRSLWEEETDLQSPDVLWSPRPAAEWAERYPIGNGRLGGMISGKPELERIGLNHDLLWREYWRYPKRDVAEILPEIRRLCREGKWDDASERMLRRVPLTGEGLYVNPYVPIGDLEFRMFHRDGSIENYRRSLDLSKGIAETSYTVNGVLFRRTYFCSWEAGAIVVRLSSSRPGSLSGEVSLSRLPDPECTVNGRSKLGEVQMTGEFEEGKRFAAAVRIFQRGGRLTGGHTSYRMPEGPEPSRNVRGIEFVFRDEAGDNEDYGASTCFDSADEVLILISASVDDETEGQPIEFCLDALNRIPPNFDRLLAEHVKEHSSFYRRVSLSLGSPGGHLPPSDELLRQAVDSGQAAPALFERLFNMGRYLAISSGRPQPAGRPPKAPINLQGIWNQDRRPAWDCDYHLDLNLQMSYWPLHAVNLGELFGPLMDWASRLTDQGKAAAEDLYGCKGIVFNASMDYNHAGTSDCMSYCWTGAAAWVAQLLWDHWEYERDMRFLRERLYPFIREIVRFYEDFLQEDERGMLLPCPSGSPETAISGRTNWSMLSSASTIDLELIREIFSNALQASDLLGVDGDKRDEWQAVLTKLPLPAIRNGMLTEWLEEHEPADPGHRHRSHLIGICPGNRISLEETPEDSEAARLALLERQRFGEGSSLSFSSVWDAQIFARLYDGEEAHEQLAFLVRNHVMDNLLISLCDWRPQGNSLRWFGGRKLFQIESSLGLVAAMSDMLLQDRQGLIRILPALPSQWSNGSVQGLCGRDRLEFDFEWENHQLVKLELRAGQARHCRLKIFGANRSYSLLKDKKVLFEFDGQDEVVEFYAEKGCVYTIVAASK